MLDIIEIDKMYIYIIIEKMGVEEMDYDKFLEKMPDNLTQIEKARWIYIQLGRFFSYDERYILTENEDERKKIFDKTPEEITGDKAVCTSISRIYEKLLKKVGIANVKTIVVPDERGGHGYNELEIDGKKYCVDLIHELVNIKGGLKTKEFMPQIHYEYNGEKEYDCLTEDELKRIDDKIGYTYHRNVYGRFPRNDKS